MTIRRYIPQDQQVWDEFVRLSKNGTFLFERSYMDYHSDRFQDHSLLCLDGKGKLLALLPANEVRVEHAFYSHQGLTYGGFILHKRTHAAEVLQLFDGVRQYLRERGFAFWHYKPVPTIYHRLPSQEDEYALFRLGATMEVCNLSCTLPLHLDAEIQLSADASRRRRRLLAEQAGLRLLTGGKELPAEEVLRRFWPIMEQNMMERYGARPVHTLEEMLMLQRRFPRQIRCYLVTAPASALAASSIEPSDCPTDNASVDVAGEVLFVSKQVAHAQYGHASALGRELGALDFLYLSLIDHYRDHEPDVQYFDFGTSNEQGGRYLNESLIAQKEGFGGRGVAYRTYLLNIE